MTPLPVSVIVVSRGRPDALTRCLTGIAQLDHPAFEVVVVADPAGLSALAKTGFSGRIKAVAFNNANISQARNLGVISAAGEIVAFIDDDAVPEPTWLSHLTQPFQAQDLAAAGGYVIGRNGISFQNTARWVDRHGQHGALMMNGDAPQVFEAPKGQAIKTEGTNCAFRRSVLAKMGGFDPAFPFYMDETDLNLRLATAGHRTAIVPLAQVHHGFAASDRRRASRMPRSLFDVGASTMVLLRRHAPGDDADPILNALRHEQKARLLRHMVAGTCEPRDVTALLQTLNDGIVAGRTRPMADPEPLPPPQDPFLQFVPAVPFGGSDWLAGRVWQGAKLRSRASALVAKGRRATVFVFSPTAVYHGVKFTAAGVWEQHGGIWGRSNRSEPAFSFVGFSGRLKRELHRVGKVRKL